MSSWGFSWGSDSPWGGADAGPAEMCELADSRILVQMDDTPGTRNFRDFMCVLVGPFGHALDVLDDIESAFDMDTAVGDQLDKIGAWIDLPRQGFGDDRYRTFLQIQRDLIRGAAVDQVNWTGTHNNTLTMVRTFIGVGVPQPIILTNYAPYTFTISIPGILAEEVPLLTRFICKSLYAGVYGFVSFASDTKVFGSTHGAVANEGIFGSVHGAVGGAAVFGHVAPVGLGGAC